MMNNLFSVFDPTSYLGISMNFYIVLLILMFCPMNFYLLSNNMKSFFIMFLKMMKNMFNEVAMEKYLGMTVICMVTFIYLMMSNLISLFPFVFTWTSHPMLTMGLGVVFWLAFIMMGFMKNFKNSVGHLVPEGSPIILSPFMVLIESISHLMRPFTLSIRLAANMMSGHLIIGLLSTISMVGISGFFCSFILQSILLLLELAVSIIQGFVFSILILLYSLEYY